MLPEPLGVDADILIYLSEPGHRERAAFLDRERIGKGHAVVLSTLAIAEVLVGRYRQDTEDEVDEFREALAGIPGGRVVAASMDIAAQAAAIRAATGLKLPDAIHLATAIVSGAAAFLTNDSALAIRGNATIPVLRLDDLIAAAPA